MEKVKLIVLTLLLSCVALVCSAQQGQRVFGTIHVEIVKSLHPKRFESKLTPDRTYSILDSTVIARAEKRLNELLLNEKKIKKGRYLFDIRFVIEKDGSLTDLLCFNGDLRLCNAAKKAIRLYGPKWKPGLQQTSGTEFHVTPLKQRR